jgi:Helix-turn-helix of DDE superfamily endonuclease
MGTVFDLRTKPATFRRLTGLSVTEFDKLLAQLEVAATAKRNRRDSHPGRRRKAGGGRHHALDLGGRLTLLLMYYRTYVSQEFLGFLFGIDKGTACRAIQEVALLRTGLFRIPERRVAIGADEIAEAFVDATEQPIHRPTRRQRRSYAGKKKAHGEAPGGGGAEAEGERIGPDGEAEAADRGGVEVGDGEDAR